MKPMLPAVAGRAALFALILGAGGAAQASTTYTFDLVHGDPNLTFISSGNTFVKYAGGGLELGKAPGSTPGEESDASSTFSVTGDFTARVQVDLSNMNPVCNICGNQVQAFLAVATGGLGDFVGTITDENGEGATTIFNSADYQFYGFIPMAYWQITRVGDVLTESFLNGGLQVLASGVVSGPQYAGAASFYVNYGSFHGNSAPGEVTYTNFTVTADHFDGLILPGSAAPEPAAWALMIAGFGLAGTALRRRRTAPA